MIEQLPIIILLSLLVTALCIPLLKKKSWFKIQVMGYITLTFVLISTIIVLIYVHQNGAFYYRFGHYPQSIGIELLINQASALFTVMIALLSWLIFMYSTSDMPHEIMAKDYGRYYTLVFILLFSMFGLLYTNDLFNTYVFMEILSITTCAIISIKRKKENYTAAFRYLMLNEIGSLSFLFGVALIYMITGYLNIDLVAQNLTLVWTIYPVNIIIAIAFMLIGISIKAAIFPFHVWLPDAHSTAPSPSSAILSAIVVKVYIIILVKVLFRVIGIDILEALNVPVFIIIVGAVGMLMGSFFALGQRDVKRVLGYSSVAQIGYIVLGIGLLSQLGLRAAFFHIISHGLMKTALFLAAGVVIYKQNIRKVDQYQGVGMILPITMTVFLIAALGMIGIPGTSGFMAKLSLAMGVLDKELYLLIAVIVLSGILNALYYLPLMISAFLKENSNKQSVMTLDKVPKRMLFPLIVLGGLILYLGFFPNALMALVDAAVQTFIGL